MQKKIKFLIIISVLGLLSLSCIQGYLINNTYKLKKKVFISETKNVIDNLGDTSLILDEINTIWQDKLENSIENYTIKNTTREQVIIGLKSTLDSLNESYAYNFKKEIAKKNIGFDIKHQKVLKSIVLLDSLRNDTLFILKKGSDKLLFGSNFTKKNSYRINSSIWKVNHSFDKKINDEKLFYTYNLQLETEDFMNIDRWQEILLRKMTFLLLTSVFIFLLVFGLLYYSIKNLITQKKIADIKTDFVNNITHELKTPLATLSLATKMLQKSNTIPTESKPIINTIERQNIRLQKLIDQVLTNSLGYQQIELHKETVNTKKFISTIIVDFQLSLDSKQIQIENNIITNTSLFIDKFYITTAILNILENAVKHGKGNTKIQLSSVITDAFLNIAIKDNGIGISKKELPHLFEKFYRVGNKEIHNVKGLGLGLYYTNQIIKAHQGKIIVESKESEGTIFTLIIPINNN